MSDTSIRVMQAMHAAADDVTPRQLARDLGEPLECVYGALASLEADGVAYISDSRRRYRRSTNSRERLWSLRMSHESTNQGVPCAT